MPTKIVFTADASVVVVDEPHEVVAKLKEGSIQFKQVNGTEAPIQLLNPGLILYIEKVS